MNIEMSRRSALGVMAGAALSLPRPARAQGRELGIVIQFGLSYLPLMVMEHEGLLAEELRKRNLPPVTLKLIRMSGSTAVNEALLAGTAELGVLGTPGLLVIAEKTRNNLGVKGIAGVSLMPMILNTATPRLKSLADIGASDRIALPSTASPQAIVLRMAADKLYGDYKRFDTNMVSLPHPEAMSALLAGTEITGHFTNPPFSNYELREPNVRRITSSNEIFGMPTTILQLAATRRFVEQDKPLAEAVVAALEEAMRRIRADPAKAAAIYLAVEPSKLSPAFVEELLRDPENAYAIEPAGIKAYADFMIKTGQLKTKLEDWKVAYFPLVHDRQGS